MVPVKREGIILEGTKLEFENEGVMNPAVIAEGNTVHMFYRAVKEGNHSTIGYCRLEGPLTVVERDAIPLIVPDFHYESQGVEDPRIVKIDDVYYLTYTAYDGDSAVGALAISSDLKHFEKKGIITSQITYPQFRPDIQYVAIERLDMLTKDFWKRYYQNFAKRTLLAPYHDHESSYIGAGCPPIETEAGWLLIYHSVYDTPSGYVYSACAALLDIDNPAIEIARLPYPLFTPTTEYELSGVVNKVCFPTGTALFGDTLYIYYGAADKQIACASVLLTALLDELKKQIK